MSPPNWPRFDNKQIEPAVVVVIAPSYPLGRAAVERHDAVGYLRESAVSVVVEQTVILAVEVSNAEVEPAVPGAAFAVKHIGGDCRVR